MSDVASKYLLRLFIIPSSNYSSLDFSKDISVSVQRYVVLVVTPSHDIISKKKGMLMHLKWYLSLLSVRFTFLCMCTTVHQILSWYCCCHHNLQSNIISIAKYIGQSFECLVHLLLQHISCCSSSKWQPCIPVLTKW